MEEVKSASNRRYDLDWLRVLAVFLVFLHHVGMIFAGGWLIENEQVITRLQKVLIIGNQWRMPLLFFVAGVGTYFALRRRTGGQYLGERTKRLLIPLIFGILFIVPPQAYYRNHSDLYASYFQFYPQFFDGVIPTGNFSWYHLWFIAYLFVFSLGVLPLFLYLRVEAGQKLISRLDALLQSRMTIFLLAIPLVMIEIALRAKWPGGKSHFVNDYANVLVYFTVFVYGYLISCNESFWQVILKHRKIALVLGLLCSSILFSFFWTQPARMRFDYSPLYILRMVLRGFNTWFWIIAFTGFAMKYLNVNNAVLRYTREAVYPFYILHQTVIVAVGFYVVQWNIGIFAKYLIISTASLIIIALMYELVIRRNNVTRFLFGTKPKAHIAQIRELMASKST